MERREKKILLVFPAILVSLLIFYVGAVYATDELFLTGVVKHVDPREGLVTVDVKSGSCPGVKAFRTEDILKLEGAEGKKISFFINSSTCSPAETYAIHGITFLRR